MVETTGNRMMTMRTTDKPFNITKKQVLPGLKDSGLREKVIGQPYHPLP